MRKIMDSLGPAEASPISIAKRKGVVYVPRRHLCGAGKQHLSRNMPCTFPGKVMMQKGACTDTHTSLMLPQNTPYLITQHIASHATSLSLQIPAPFKQTHTEGFLRFVGAVNTNFAKSKTQSATFKPAGDMTNAMEGIVHPLSAASCT